MRDAVDSKRLMITVVVALAPSGDAPGATPNKHTLQWSAPTENIDGSPLTDLAGFRIYSLDSTGVYNVVAELNDPGLTSYALDIAIGSYQFVMTAFDSDGNESGFSNSVVKTVSSTSI